MRTALYARVSTTDQTCEMQLRELREYAARRGWEIASEYVDTGWSGAKASRPELDRLMQDARARRFDAVLVWKLDRWGRSVADSIRSIQELVSLGVRFLAVTQNLDTDESNPMSRFLLHILAAFADYAERAIMQSHSAELAPWPHVSDAGLRIISGRTRKRSARRVFNRPSVAAYLLGWTSFQGLGHRAHT